MLLTQAVANVSVSDTGIYALLGYGLVFFGLVLLMFVVMLLGRIFVSAKKKSADAPQNVKEIASVPAPEAPGTAGSLKLHGVDPRTAAMLMAIVADKMGKPLNELRFLSIKEVEK